MSDQQEQINLNNNKSKLLSPVNIGSNNFQSLKETGFSSSIKNSTIYDFKMRLKNIGKKQIKGNDLIDKLVDHHI